MESGRPQAAPLVDVPVCFVVNKTSEAVLLVLLMEINGSMLNSSGSQVHVATNPVLRPRH